MFAKDDPPSTSVSFLLDESSTCCSFSNNAEAISLENTAIWMTRDKSFETWICPLSYALIGYCDDIILRLCQDIVLLKSEVAELVLPNVVVNLAGRKDLDVDLCKLISSQPRYLHGANYVKII
ncbi:unnamed protein product [Ilex paraguariensis]|uniref:Uncharacterized protein n=1 Tax=Ilex paraguariensis TaxID=185542 RepID=A0ABC8QYU5_9AQUA